MPFLTPDVDTALVDIKIRVPVQFERSVFGALLELTYPENWEEFGAATVDYCVSAMIDSLDGVTVEDVEE